MAASFETRLKVILAKDSRYSREAYCFLFEALEYTYRHLKRRGHVSGRELAEGIRDFAIDQFGGLTRMVLETWGLHSTLDFGEIVFSLVDAGLMGKTETDSIEDFRNVYEFAEAFPIDAGTRSRRAR